ncbi:MAG: hypothetical protein HUU38_04765 [Anaerolineales bacterium]|nr:hypothetical protein [Anaerolineales bacterium]
MDKLDRTKLNEFSAKLLEYFIEGFPKETIYLIDNYKDGWVITWLRPAGKNENWWHVWLSFEAESLIVHWGGDHQDFFPFWEGFPQDEVQSCLNILKNIFDERLVSVDFYDNRQKYPNVGGTWCPPEKIDTFRNKQGISSYEVKSWRGTYDRMIEL